MDYLDRDNRKFKALIHIQLSLSIHGS